MPNGRNVSAAKLQGWKQNFLSNANLPFITTGATVGIDELERFIENARGIHGESFGGFRIYPIRYSLAGEFNPNDIQMAGNGLSQAALAFVPVDFSTPNGGNDLSQGGQFFVLSFSDPEDPGGSAVLCPPKCG